MLEEGAIVSEAHVAVAAVLEELLQNLETAVQEVVVLRSCPIPDEERTEGLHILHLVVLEEVAEVLVAILADGTAGRIHPAD